MARKLHGNFTCTQVDPNKQRSHQRNLPAGFPENLHPLREEDPKGVPDSVHNDVTHQGAEDDHPTPASVRWGGDKVPHTLQGIGGFPRLMALLLGRHSDLILYLDGPTSLDLKVLRHCVDIQ